MKYLLPILVVLLFPFGYWICLYFYPDDVVKFFDLRMNLYACIILLCFIVSKRSVTNKAVIFIFDTGIGMSISDVADRLYFDVTEFQKSDIVMIVLTILFAIADYHKKWILNKIHDLLCQTKK